MLYREIHCVKALHKLEHRALPFRWDLNVFRGCLHGCRYCFAMYSHDYLEQTSDEFFDNIYVKTNVVEALEKQLRMKSWRRETINIGGVTDSYQPAEARYRLMPDILKLLIKYKTPATFSTKSVLALRDYDLIDELSRAAGVNIASTIISTEKTFLRRLEPRAAKPESRFAMLKAFKKTRATVGVHLMPIIPYLNDSEQNLDELLAMAREAGVDYVLPGMLYLRGRTRSYFLDFVRQEYPEHYQRMLTLYRGREQRQQYRQQLYRRLNPLFEKHCLSRHVSIRSAGRGSGESGQLSLF